jgi:hypothetical protein
MMHSLNNLYPLAARLSISVLLVSLAACGGDNTTVPKTTTAAGNGTTIVSAPTSHSIDILSSRPDTVTGGDTLVRVKLPPGIADGGFTVLAAGRDVTSSFEKTGNGIYVGLVAGLAEGANTIEVKPKNGNGLVGSVQVTNHPVTGPVFSGPHESPFFCETEKFRLPDGSMLGAAVDADCSVNTRVDYVYRTTTTPASFKPLKNLEALPSDVATTTTNEGKTVPYVVRVETGTINRAIYQTSVLHDPTTEPTPNYARSSAGWNGRLIYTFGGGCTGGWYRQGSTTGGVLDHNILKQGYAMASSSLNVFGNNCQDLTAAESMAMVKERFIETYGLPRYTIGWGCSGGSYQQHQIADNYPGLLDGILPGCSFPEVGFATVYSITDQRLLGNYFRNVMPGQFSDEQQRQVAGVENVKTIYTSTVYNGALRIAPTTFCPDVLPQDMRYHPVNNPTGVRCDIYQHTVNVYGKDPSTGFARRPLDNVGVQYGLQALNDGVITVDQFITLNERIGGYDRDANFSPQRTAGDAEAMRQAYQTGRLTSGGGGLRDIPIIDYRAYSDDAANGDIHLRYHSFSMRERLAKANGDAKNQVMLVEDFRYGYYSSSSPLLLHALAQMDMWLANMAADKSSLSQHEKVVRNKPETLQEGCLTRDPEPTFIAEEQKIDSGQCAALYPAPPSPRAVAGAPIESDIIKCQLKPVTMSDYTPVLTPEQQSRLMTVFSGGVCDWSKPGEQQQGLRGTWLSF